jgi:hypothetical protein
VDDLKLVESFDKVPGRYMRMEDSRYFNVTIKTDWKVFMYANEYFSPQLLAAFPSLLENEEFDYFSFYKLRKEYGKLKYSISPRMYRSDIRMRDNMAYPVDIESLKGIPILNGFVLQV